MVVSVLGMVIPVCDRGQVKGVKTGSETSLSSMASLSVGLLALTVTPWSSVNDSIESDTLNLNRSQRLRSSLRIAGPILGSKCSIFWGFWIFPVSSPN